VKFTESKISGIGNLLDGRAYRRERSFERFWLTSCAVTRRIPGIAFEGVHHRYGR
jgi:hypothetical protein